MQSPRRAKMVRREEEATRRGYLGGRLPVDRKTLTSYSSYSGVSISASEFLEYYADVNATLPKEKEDYFVDILLSTWGITSSVNYVSAERLAYLKSTLYEKIR